MQTALQFALLAMQLAAETSEHLEWSTGRVRHFADTGSDPSAQDWAELNARTDALRARLNNG